MPYEIKQNVIDPVRMGFDWVERRLGRTANRYQEASIEVQPEENFHYRPLWDPTHEIFDETRSRLRLSDWYAFTDPRQYYYYPYNVARSKAAEQMNSSLQYMNDSGVFENLGEPWKRFFTDLLGPLRHYEYGAQLALAEISRFSYGTTIEQCAIYSAFDHLGNAQQITKLVLQFPDSLALLAHAKELWMDGAALQPIRQYIEDALVVGDWGEQWVALQVCMASYLYPLLFKQAETIGQKTGLGMGGMALRSFYTWYRDDRRWSEELLSVFAKEEQYPNRMVLGELLSQWRERARTAVLPLAAQLSEIGGGMSPEELVSVGEHEEWDALASVVSM